MAEFRHTLRHEMVHVFQISLLYDRYYRSPRSAQMAVPLGFTEGLAELWSGGEDARDEMIMRDLVYSGRLPRVQDLGFVTGGIVYPLGGRLHRWLADTYGDWRVATLYRELWRYENFEEAVAGTYGRSLPELNEEFQYAMRRQYYPLIEGRASLPASGRLIARAAIKPAYSPNDNTGGDLVFASAGNGFVTLVETPIDGGPKDALVATFSLIGRRQLRSNNSWMHNSERLVRGKERCTVLVNRGDAAALGLADGQMVEVRSRVGYITLPAELTDDIMPGVVSIPHGWGHNRPGIRLDVAQQHPGASLNDLTDDHALDELTGNAAFSAIPVTLSV